MSTEYFRFKAPFTSAKAEVVGFHTRLTLFVNHANAGEITLRNEEVFYVLRVLSRDKVAVIRYAKGGGETGIQFEDDDVDLDTTLVSQYGTLAKLTGEWEKPDEWQIIDL